MTSSCRVTCICHICLIIRVLHSSLFWTRYLVNHHRVYSMTSAGVYYMMMSSDGGIFRVTGRMCGEFTGHWWIPLTRASDAELWCSESRDIGVVSSLTHWGRGKMADIFQTTFSNEFSWMKMCKFRLRFHWSLFPRVQLTIFHHWFR